jgi:hypothetical protein
MESLRFAERFERNDEAVAVAGISDGGAIELVSANGDGGRSEE